MTGPASLVSVSVRMAAAAAALLAIGFVLACEDGDEEILTITGSATPTSVASATATPASSPTAEPTPVPTVPPDWKTYSDPDGLFTARYPSSWFASNGTFSTFQLGSVGPTFPPGGVKIDVGAVDVDQLGSCATPAAGAVTATAGGLQGWRFEKDDSGTVAGHSIQVFVEGGAYCYGILALFASDVKQYAVFDEFLAGLKFEK